VGDYPPGISTSVVIAKSALEQVFANLRAARYTLIGPTIRDGAIVYEEITSLADLPVGWTDEQDGGSYRLKRRDDQALFGYAVGPQSWKKFLHPPWIRLWQARRNGRDENAFQIVEEPQQAPRYAFLGVRSCEIHAIAIQDKVFLQGSYADPIYKTRRENVFILAVNCGQASPRSFGAGQAGSTCFCASMKTGPRATFGFDLALTEVLERDRHYFLVEIGTEAGARMLEGVPHTEATEEERAASEQILARLAERMGRTMESAGLKELLYRNYEHPRWDDVAARCLACANCTMVCPTCFCTTVEDVTSLTGDQAERSRKWDSCFTLEFSYIHGGSVRSSTRARYRQWMTHKLATWIDQFGTSGCVGCGRCITWCPVGIDITEEVRAIRESEAVRVVNSAKEKSGGNT
jgi:formate hydrogenlyase subunit 6/NADH:ubiquinone oxidoreductase subunit I